MSRADERFEAFAKAMRAGSPVDSAKLFDDLDRVERLELEDLIDGFLSSSETAPTDLAGFDETRRDDASLERLGRAVTGVSGLWPSTLPRLRNQMRLGRDELADRLVEELGNPSGADKVKGYYHRMEWGDLPSSGVNDRVVESLARILDADADELRRAGRFSGAGGGSGEAGQSQPRDRDRRRGRFSVFARMIGSNQAASMAAPEPDLGRDQRVSESDWDETDRLFRGG